MQSRLLLSVLAALLALPFSSATVRAQQFPDTLFQTAVAHPAHAAVHPRVLVDGAHRNLFTANERIQKFVELITSDGLRVAVDTIAPFTPAILDSFDIVVITTVIPTSPEEPDTVVRSTFTEQEIAALHTWVENGGALLIAADHYPYDLGVQPLLARFGVDVSIGRVGDTMHFDPTAPDPREIAEGWIVYSRENGLLGSHRITEGRNPDERIERIVAFGGSSISGPAGSTEFLRLGPSASNRPHAGHPAVGLGRAQGVAFPLGKGRVVVLGDATMLTAQRVEAPNQPPFLLGMGRPGIDNRQLALNVMRWLSGALP